MCQNAVFCGNGLNKGKNYFCFSLFCYTFLPVQSLKLLYIFLCTSTDDVQLRNKSVRRVAPAPPCRISSVGDNERDSSEKTGLIEDNVSEISNRKLNSTANSIEDGFSVDIRDVINRVDSASSPISFLTVDEVSKEANSSDEGLVNLDAVDIPEGLGNELIEDVRRNTGLSYPMSVVAVETVLGQIGIKVPEVAVFLDRIFDTVNTVSSNDYAISFQKMQKLEKVVR